MSARYDVAEQQYVLQSKTISALNQVIAASNAARVVVSKPPVFIVTFNKKEHKKVLVATANSVKTIADLHFTGVLMVASGAKDVDDARLIAYPIVDAIRAALEGFVPDMGSTWNGVESIGPTYVLNEEAINLQVGYYAMMIDWKFEMSFSKGVA